MTFQSAPVEVLTVDAASPLLTALQRESDLLPASIRSVDGLRAAETACRERAPDLILLDFGTGSLENGFELCRLLQGQGAIGTSPLVLFGTGWDAAGVTRGSAYGAIDFVEALLEPGLLQARLRMHLGLAQGRVALQTEQRARRAAESAMRVAHRGKNDLLERMGHEIRTPMTGILGMAHLALQSGLNPRQRNYVEKVERAAGLLLGTLNDIVDSSRIEAGTLELQPAAFQLADLLAAVGRLVALRAEEKGIELLFEASIDLPPTLVGDLARLTQVLVNLGLDAVRCAEHGEIIIGVEALEQAESRTVLRFSVRGSGVVATHRSAPGTDLGATLSRQLLRLMGSQLLGTEQPPTHSVHFVMGFDLPRLRPPRGASPSPGARVLIVDDNASARRILLGMCAELQLQAEAARDGWDALRAATGAQRLGLPFDLVLLDCKMPGMDGIECARHLLAQRDPPAILMLTAFGQHDAMQRLTAQRVTVRGVLAKPVTASDLGPAIGAALRHHPATVDRSEDHARSMRDNAARLRGARILLVEDNAIIQELALELLSSVGMAVSLAENGREALDRLAKQSFDGVLMDCQMPVLDGYETTRALRAMPHLAELPVIALTASALEIDRARVIDAGMNDHIAKPIDVALMFETLARWVRPARPVAAPAAVPPSAADDPLARLPGIDVQVGRNSTMNNDKLYGRLLGMFRDGQRDVVAQFRAARSAGDDATAMRLAHNLRAVSASLGALAVQQSAGALERACADKSPDSTVDPLLAQVELDLTPVITGLTERLPPRDQAASLPIRSA